MLFAIIREPDDPLAESRISLGKARNEMGMYLTFRGDPEKTVELLRTALLVAEQALPSGMYEDKRGRPQG